jgi:hypothetical protein
MMDLGWLNNFGIVMEIAGFIMILIAIRATKPENKSTFDSIWSDLGNVMTTKHPWVNRIGILMVIGGLVIQLASNASAVNLNYTFNIESPPTDILQASVTLLVGLLIFFTLGRRFRLMDHIWKGGTQGDIEKRLSGNGWILFLMVLFAALAATLSLVESWFLPLGWIAVIFLISSLVLLVILIFGMLYRPPPQSNT